MGTHGLLRQVADPHHRRAGCPSTLHREIASATKPPRRNREFYRRAAPIVGLAVMLGTLFLVACSRSSPSQAPSPRVATSHQAMTATVTPAPTSVRTPKGTVATHTCQTDADCGSDSYCARWQGLGKPEFFCYPGRHPLHASFFRPPAAAPR